METEVHIKGTEVNETKFSPVQSAAGAGNPFVWQKRTARQQTKHMERFQDNFG